LDKYDRSAFAFDQAEQHNCDILVATPTTLLLDLDTDEQYRAFLRNLDVLRRETSLVVSYEELKSRSGNRHVVVSLAEPLDITTRLLLQAVLGSDPVRELLSYLRARDNDPMPSLLFRPRVIHAEGQSEAMAQQSGEATR